MTKPVDSHQDDYYASIKKDADAKKATKKPLKIKKPVIKKKPIIKKPVPSATAKKEDTTKTTAKKQETPKSKVRLVEREHASKGLLRSVMGKQETKKSEEKKPNISFGTSSSEFKPLENRPVMKTPEEERREQRKKQRQRKRAEERNEAPKKEARLRDDSKPIFQRDIGFSDPVRDGTKKQGKKRYR